MKRNQASKAPTPFTFSGILGYCAGSYRPLKDMEPVPAMPSPDSKVALGAHYDELKKYPVMPTSDSKVAAKPHYNDPKQSTPSLDPKVVAGTHYNDLKQSTPPLDPKVAARTHYDELKQYLVVCLAQSPPDYRSTARQKLSRLTQLQFHELSTDVYDELVRRKMNTPEKGIPFLPARDDFHPKRNQAREKLSTLRTTRFEDLSSDVLFELSRRHPEFTESEVLVAYDDMPSSDLHASPRSDAQTQERVSGEKGVNGTRVLGHSEDTKWGG